ncbi:TPA: ABC transporter ATP-binding protein [bacterium]|nr:ABC transporter ATP-binding protein [bacterium]
MENKVIETGKNDNICLKTVELCKSYKSGQNELQVLQGIDITVKKGEIITIVGASGSGKTTLLNLLGTLDRPTSGTVFYQDQDIFSLNDKSLAQFRNREIGFVFQFHHLLPEFSAIENVMMPILIANESKDKAFGLAKELLQTVGLNGREHHRPSELSGGEQQRVAVARALVNNPNVVLADEPTGNLDRITGEAIHELLYKLNEKMNQTFIIVTHNESLAERADRIIKLTDGKVEILKGD